MKKSEKEAKERVRQLGHATHKGGSSGHVEEAVTVHKHGPIARLLKQPPTEVK